MSENNYQLIDDPNYLLIKEAFEKGEYIGLEVHSVNQSGDPITIIMNGFVTHYTKIGFIFVYGQYINKDKEGEDIVLVKNSIYYQDIISVISPYVIHDNKDALAIVKMRDKALSLAKDNDEMKLIQDNVIAEATRLEIKQDNPKTPSKRKSLIIASKRSLKDILLMLIGRG